MKNNSQNPEERRQYLRKEIYANMTYRELMPSGEEGIIQDMSDGGLCLILNKKFSPGTVLEVKYVLPEEENRIVEKFVRVVWVRKTENKYLTGARFSQ
jgi:c-di-GMP-binding flagellar brake protein YcgR